MLNFTLDLFQSLNANANIEIGQQKLLPQQGFMGPIYLYEKNITLQSLVNPKDKLRLSFGDSQILLFFLSRLQARKWDKEYLGSKSQVL